MRYRLIAPAALVAALGCSEPSAGPSPEPSAAVAPSVDAAPSKPAPVLAPPAAGQPDPGFHLDPDPTPSRPVARPTRSRSRPVELILRSTPPGATASVDGQPVGKTPALWSGTTDGRPRDVTFALPGYAVARYRFIATRNGVVHGQLRRLAKAEPEPDRDPGARSEP